MLERFFLSKSFFRRKFRFIDIQNESIFIIFNRSSFITDNFLNSLVRVYAGKQFIQFNVEDYHIGRRFGEFSFTKKMGIYIHLGSGKNLKVKRKMKLLKN